MRGRTRGLRVLLPPMPDLGCFEGNYNSWSGFCHDQGQYLFDHRALLAALYMWPMPASAQEGSEAPLSLYRLREGFISAGFWVSEPVSWDWTSPPFSTVQVRDPASARVLMVLAYPTTSAALTARHQAENAEYAHRPVAPIVGGTGPHLVPGTEKASG